MNELELAYAIRDEYNRWDAEDLAAHPRPSEEKDSDKLRDSINGLPSETEEDMAEIDRVREMYFAALDAESAELDAYDQAREERWAIRRAEFLASLETPARRGRK